MQKLPIGIQNFSELRTGGYLYVDKTKDIHNLVTSGKYYFMSRPRRFGKSLLVSTMKELFSGSKELFTGLWIEDRWDWSKTHPVLHIPFSSLDYQVNGLYEELQQYIQNAAKEHEIELQPDSLKNQFEELLRKLAAKKNRVVLLIDEYDKPIIDYLGKEIEQAKENREILKNFYSIIKDSDPHLRLVFITGVSKFSKVSIFSDLNNLNDITLHKRYSTMLGYTQEELEANFTDHIKALAEEEGLSDVLQKIKHWYNGYSWDARKFVYNPFSILLLFDNLHFTNHWFKTATPTFLIDLIQKQQYYDFDGVQVNASFFDAFQIDRDIPLGALLFQTGYLTIKSYDPTTDLYTLGYPNWEVRKSMLEYLLSAFASLDPGMEAQPVLKARRALQEENIEQLVEVINHLLYNLPHQLHDQREERFYHLLLHIFFDYIGLEIHSEVNTARGRLDAVVELEDKVYCFEFKYNGTASEALAQIKQRGYLDKYRSSGKKLIAIGINFNSEKREVDPPVVEVCDHH